MTTTTPLPVTAVTCLEDRALVERSVELDLAPGVQRLRLGPVTALAADLTLRAELSTGSVLDTRITRIWTPPAPEPPGDQDSELRHRVHALEQEQAELGAERLRLTARLALLGQLATDLLREIAEGAGQGETEPARWTRELDRVDAEREEYGERLRATDARLIIAEEDHARAEAAVELSEREQPELLGFLELTVDSPGGPNRLTVSHLTPCALWRPAYRATLAEDGALTLETEAVVWQATGEDWSGVELTLSTARSALAGEPPRLTEDVLTLRPRTTEERRTVEVELREQAIGSTGPATDGLPGVDDGGEVRVLRAPAPARIPRDGRSHRVPLTVFSTPATSEYSCAPELSPLVTRVARFTNAAGHALLAGPVDLVLGSGFTGRAELEFTAPGAPAELSFGSSDAYRVLRETEETRSSAGALSSRTVQTRTVRLHLSRFAGPDEHTDQPVTLRERIPVSEVAAVEVRLRKELCSPAPDDLDADGIARWQLTLPPGGRRTVTLVYEVSATAKVAGL
ncbi:uncharacterized protein (TIGR02231 family) [Kitasatospora gansuensis]|uniref:Uncharacterized protein (TIGR02231 family) n=1 Tax=Kitasatospora gansuensis TaxID=258050 RepID=A0A7W7WH50_9ACTN|nr:DUF4139 domain-containing protein [Kitasatospora gansuensis]MBB4946169.1 uncharacterized protein (TIGR02231 family) [Kitasatospora gansuensis]